MILFAKRKKKITEVADSIEAIVDPVVVGGSIVPHKLSEKEIEEMYPEDIKDERTDYSFIIMISLQGKDGKIHEYEIGGYGIDTFDKREFDDAALFLKANIDAANSVISENKNMTLKEFVDKIDEYKLNNITQMN